MDLKPQGRKMAEQKLEKLERYGSQWDLEYINDAIEYYASTFISRYFKK